VPVKDVANMNLSYFLLVKIYEPFAVILVAWVFGMIGTAFSPALQIFLQG
jgi:hypothetical protein